MAKQGNQVGEISIGVTANTDTLKQGLREAEVQVGQTAQKMGQAGEAGRAGFDKASKGASGFGETVKATKRSFAAFTSAISSFGAVVGVFSAFFAIGQRIKSLFEDLTVQTGLFFNALNGQDAASQLKAIEKELSELQSHMGKSMLDRYRELDFTSMSAFEKQAAMLERQRDILVRRLTTQRNADEVKARTEAAQKAADQEADIIERFNIQRRDAESELADERTQIARRYEARIRELDRETLKLQQAGQWRAAKAAIAAGDAIWLARNAALEKFDKDQKKKDEEAAQRAADEYAKQFTEVAKTIQDALTNAFSASSAASQAMTRQVTSDISQIIPLLQQLVRNQRR